MPSELDKEREHYRRMAEQAAERNRPEPALLSDPQLLVLVDHLNNIMDGCDNTQRLTRDWLAKQSVDHPIEEILLWLGRQGGACDCEVAANLYDRLEYLRPQPPRRPRKKKQKREARSLANPMGWSLDSLPRPWRIANMFIANEPIQIQMGKKGGCSLTLIDQTLPIENLGDDSAWAALWHARTDLPKSKVHVEYSSLQLPDGLRSITASSPRWTPVYSWLFTSDNNWYVQVLTETNRRQGDFLLLSQLLFTLHETA